MEHGGQSAGVQAELVVLLLGGVLRRRIDQGFLGGVAALDEQDRQILCELLAGPLEAGCRVGRLGRVCCFVRHWSPWMSLTEERILAMEHEEM
ncbi:hypothetical protein OG933_44705 [Streptomyces sp. NBC_00016]|uniref:hypothetical protein n=1 Tax=Streptomyces sp. NBC_00016 TaxID=2975622 RepID=UPI0032459EC6